MKKISVLVLAIIITICIPVKKCYGKTDVDSLVDGYDYSDIDNTANDYTDYHIDFKEMIENIIGNNGDFFTVKNYINSISSMIKANENAVIQIVIMGLLSALLKTISIGSYTKQINETSQMILSIALILVLTAVFSGAVITATDVLKAMVHFYEAVCPVFFPAVVMVGGNISAAAYYEIVMMMIGVINVVFKNILIKLNGIYMLLGIADSITEDSHYSKACELIEGVIKYVTKTALVVFLGLNGIKGMIAPYLDSEKNNILYRSLSVIPGVGNTALAVSKTMLGAGAIVKNSIGVAAIIVIVILSAMPVIKLVVLVVLYKAIAAFIEPVADKGIVSAVNLCSRTIGNLLQIILVTIALLIMTIGIICVTTNINYGT